MRREGRQHGFVRKWSLREHGLLTTPGAFQKVQCRPTNHSKFTGACRRPRCYGCHSSPVNKSSYKDKGKYRLKCDDVAINHRLVAWRIVDSKRRSNNHGLSAAHVLECLLGDHLDEDEHDEVQEELHNPSTFTSELNFNAGNAQMSDVIGLDHVAAAEIFKDDRKDLKVDDYHACYVSDSDDLVICDFEIEFEIDDGEGWCLVKDAIK